MVAGKNQPSDMRESTALSAVWEALQQVKDPEIPVVSVVELGLIRQIGLDAERLVVTMTPSFIGCPALDVMQREIEMAVQAVGYPQFEVRVVYQPPWSSDWITSDGREKLRQFGLSPPPHHGGDLPAALEAAALCPYCESDDTELKNSFGPTLCRAIYYCNACHQPFEQFKPL